MIIILIVFLIGVIVWQAYQTLKLAKAVNEEIKTVWEAINKINEGSYLIKEK